MNIDTKAFPAALRPGYENLEYAYDVVFDARLGVLEMWQKYFESEFSIAPGSVISFEAGYYRGKSFYVREIGLEQDKPTVMASKLKNDGTPGVSTQLLMRFELFSSKYGDKNWKLLPGVAVTPTSSAGA